MTRNEELFRAIADDVDYVDFGVGELMAFYTDTPAAAVATYARQIENTEITEADAQRIAIELGIEVQPATRHLAFPTDDGDTCEAWCPRGSWSDGFEPTNETRPCVWLDEDDQSALTDAIGDLEAK